MNLPSGDSFGELKVGLPKRTSRGMISCDVVVVVVVVVAAERADLICLLTDILGNGVTKDCTTVKLLKRRKKTTFMFPKLVGM